MTLLMPPSRLWPKKMGEDSSRVIHRMGQIGIQLAFGNASFQAKMVLTEVEPEK